MPRAYVGIGSNLNDPAQQVRNAVAALTALGTVEAQSSLYRSLPWGKRDQPDFVNAVVALDTGLSPRRLLAELKAIEARFGRGEGERWGPRVVDLDILLYDDERIDEPGLTIPHARLFERAFALVPLAEIDERYGGARDALGESELASVTREPPAGAGASDSESVALMSEDHHPTPLADRVRHLAGFFVTTDLLRIRIEREGEEIELGRKAPHLVAAFAAGEADSTIPAQPLRLDAIKADLVGIFHLGRPAPAVGDVLEAERELGYIEALGIRNPVRSLGPGRIASIKRSDGEPVEYGEVLFEIDRG